MTMQRHQCTCGWSISVVKSTYVTCIKCGHRQLYQYGNEQQFKPRWVRLLEYLSKPEDIGLGATVKRIAARFGGERFKAWATKIGLPCGCTEREVELNSLYPNQHYRQP